MSEKTVAALIGTLVMVGIMAGSCALTVTKYRECRAHGFSFIYCATR